MYNKTIADYFVESKDCVVTFCSRHFYELIVVAVYMLIFSLGKKVWMHLFHAILFLNGIALLVDTKGTGLMSWSWEDVDKFDDTHLMLARLVGVVQLGVALSYWLLYRSTDSTVQTALLWKVSVMCWCMMLADGYMQTHLSKKSSVPKMKDGALRADFLSGVLLTLGTTYFALRSSDWGGYGEVSSHANFHLRMEFAFLMLIGVIAYAFPQTLLKEGLVTAANPDPIHVLFYRVIGSYFIGNAVATGRAANFLRQSDKDCLMVENLITDVLLTCLGGYLMWRDWATIATLTVALSLLQRVILIMNAFGALDRDVTVFARLVLPRVKAIPDDVKSCLMKLKAQ